MSRLLFYLPAIRDLRTGGNYYNRMLMKALRQRRPVEWVVVDHNFSSTRQRISDPATVHLIDSLLLSDERFGKLLEEGAFFGTKILLAHYVNLIDPARRIGKAAERERALLPLFRGIVATSRYTADCLREAGFGKVGVVRPGLAPGFRTAVPGRQPKTPVRLLTVSSLLPGKGLEAFLADLSALRNETWEWRLVGENRLSPGFTDSFRRQLEGHPLADRVRLTDPQPPSKLLRWYDRSHVFVLPSAFESCSMVTMEAMARGLPVVAYAVGGIPELVRHGETGFLAPAGNRLSFREYLRQLIVDGETRQRFGEQSREQSQMFDSWAEAAGRFEAFLNSLPPQ